MQKWQENDYISAAELLALQEHKLSAIVKHASRSPFYKEYFKKAGIDPQKIKKIDDLKSLPFTTKADLRKSYPYGMAAVPMDRIVRIHASSGTTGKPIVMGYTKGDVAAWAETVARICVMAGVTPADIVQISFGYGLFTGGFGLHYGLEKLGAMVLPFSSGNTERQLMLMKDFRTTALVSTPSFALYMAEVALEKGVEPTSLNLRLGLFGGELCSDLVREEIQRKWKIRATSNYGLTEVGGPGVSGECEELDGMHILEDCFIAEIIDPETGLSLPDGEAGELVLTPLMKKGFPVIRYRTGDITRFITEPCRCGRSLKRMGYITGRTDDMIIFKGVNIFPSQIEEVLATFKEVSSHYRLVVYRDKDINKDLEVQVELAPEGFSDSFRVMELLENNIRSSLRSSLSVSPRVKLMDPKTLQRTTGKSKRVFVIEGDETLP